MLILFALLTGCKATKNQPVNQPVNTENLPEQPVKLPNDIFEGKDYVVEAQVLTKQFAEGFSKDDLCGAHPCIGKVMINHVLKMGLVPNSMLQEGGEVEFYFRMSMDPTDPKFFPDTENPLPGLEIGDTFSAKIVIRPGNPQRFDVFEYYKNR